jgi:tetratricopeptide (TPR) repeat protein
MSNRQSSIVNRQLWIVALVAALLYLPALSYDFTFDDGTIVARNPAVQDWGNWKLIFFSDYWPEAHSALYRPATILSFALERLLHGSAPSGFHLTNLLLHSAVSAMVFLLATRLIGATWGAVLAGILFAVHPLHCEAVSGIVGRAELLSSLFALGVFWIWVGDSDSSRSSGWRPSVLKGMLLYLLALGAKENVIILPGVLLLYEISRADAGGRWTQIRQVVQSPKLWGFIAVTLGFLAVRSLALGGIQASLTPAPSFVENPLEREPPAIRILSALSNQWHALVLHVIPRPLIADYSFETLPVVHSWMNLKAVAMLLFAAGSLALWGMRHRLASILILVPSWYLLAVLPTSNIPMAIGTVFAERLLYFPSVAFCIGVGALVSAALGREAPMRKLPASRAGKAILCCSLLVVLAFSALTLARNPVWRDDLALFTDTVNKAPRNVKARLWLGDSLVRSGDLRAAIDQYRAALEIHPDYAPAAANLVVPLKGLGRLQEAIDTGERARALFGRENAGLLYNLALTYLEAGEPVPFLDYMGRVIKLDPNNSRAHLRLGFYYFQRGSDRAAARAHLEQALRSNPSAEDAVVIRNLLAKLSSSL